MKQTENRNSTANVNRSTEKALVILETLAHSVEPMRLLDIAHLLNYNQSTTLRFLSSLMNSGYVAQEAETQRYYLTYKISRIANLHNSHQNIPSITHPYLVELSQAFSEFACISVEQQFSMVYIDVANTGDQVLMSRQQIGNTAPMHCTGNGKLLLSTFDEKKLAQLIERVGLRQYTPNTITSGERLREELETIRRMGYAMDNEECELGIRCIAYPIRDYTGQIIAGLSVTGPISRMQDERILHKRPEIERIAREISERLGYQA